MNPRNPASCRRPGWIDRGRLLDFPGRGARILLLSLMALVVASLAAPLILSIRAPGSGWVLMEAVLRMEVVVQLVLLPLSGVFLGLFLYGVLGTVTRARPPR